MAIAAIGKRPGQRSGQEQATAESCCHQGREIRKTGQKGGPKHPKKRDSNNQPNDCADLPSRRFASLTSFGYSKEVNQKYLARGILKIVQSNRRLANSPKT